MITYESLKELAHALSKVTNKRYVAFESLDDGYELNVSISDDEIVWNQELEDNGYWDGDDIDYFTIFTGECELFDFDWSKCQFDCKEEQNEQEI